ncbi:MAG: KaiC domain-containing protein [Thaumarchaeota archaeon]|jgi:KaiC domain protein|nr:KaiC domain-containing protein [Nitrososphaerota archaeon]
MKIYRVRTYVPGFDEILYGGIPERNVVLVSGGPGTGKSILAKQFLYNGLLKGEHGVFVALEEHPVSVRRSFAHFSWDITKYEKEGELAIVDAFTAGIGSSAQRENYVVKDPESVQELVDVLRAAIKNTGAKRVAIDSVSTLYLTKPALARGTVMILKRVIAGLGNTALFVSQISVGERGFGGPGVEHAVDGIVRIDLDEVEGRLYRSILVWKMRDSKISMVRHPMEINDEGIKVLWDKSLNISPTGAKISELPEDIKEEMKKAVEEAEKGVHEVQEEF